MGNNNLTPQQEKFIEGLVQGMNLIDAYHFAGYKGNGNTSYANASRIARNAKIRHEFEERIADGTIQVKALTPKALNILVDILNMEDNCDARIIEIKRKVAESILDRAGLKPELVARLVGDEKQPIFVTFEGLDNGGSK